jgi:hypothetical protein
MRSEGIRGECIGANRQMPSRCAPVAVRIAVKTRSGKVDALSDDPHDQNVASRATRPSEHDVAIAEEVILGALAGGRVAHWTNMIEVVKTRFVDEPTPELFSQLQDVTDDDCRAAWTAASAMTALANLQWTGQIIPCDALDVPNLPQLVLQWRSPHGGGPLRDMQSEYAFPIGRQLRIAPWLKAIGPDSLALLRAPIPGSGEKVTRVLREAAEAYRRGLNVAGAILLGVASEAAWVEFAEAIHKRTNDAELASLLESDRARAAALAARCVELLPSVTGLAGSRQHIADI